MKRFFFSAALLIAALTMQAQTVTVEAEYTYCAPPNVSPVEAKAEAIKRARIEALEKQFGRLISSNSFLSIEKVGVKSRTLFNTLGESEVKGEWLRDLKEPKVLSMEYMEDMSTCITVQVKGEAMEIKSAPVKYDVKILRNGTEARFESDDFRENDRFYMSFRSPVSGYLAIYMIDDEGNAFRLIPYAFSNESSMPVDQDRNYILFSEKHGGEGIKTICEQPIEFNHIYTIFSSTPFTRSLDKGVSKNDDGILLPPTLSLKDFQKWFVDIRKHNKTLSVDRRTIRVTKQE